MTTFLQRQNGFTLLELLIALTVFAVGLLGIAGLQARAIGLNSGAHIRTVATSLARGVLEGLLIADGEHPVFATAGVGKWSLDSQVAKDYAAEWEVATNDPVSHLSRVTVTVTGPRSQKVTLTGFKRVH